MNPPKLLYVANIRLPTEKAHGVQIMQNCEAFAAAGYAVTLWATRRTTTPELRGITDVWAHYGVAANFAIRRLPCVDFLFLVPNQTHTLAKLIFLLQQFSFLLVALLRGLFTPAEVVYSRDPWAVLLFSFIKSGVVYEAHSAAQGGLGRRVQAAAVRRARAVITVTGRLAHDLQRPQPALAPKFLVAHDGIRAERFANVPDQAAARAALGWPSAAFIVGYVGRLQTMGMDKGVGLLVEALRGLEGVTLALVGGPEAAAEAFRAQWLAAGLPNAHFLNAGQVPPERVPLYLSALDVGTMPFPWTEHFAYYASPMKLFEYMASGRPIIASDLPSTAEVVQHEQSALLYPVGDAAALAAAVQRLRTDRALGARLAHNAQDLVQQDYTWAARARRILAHVAAQA